MNVYAFGRLMAVLVAGQALGQCKMIVTLASTSAPLFQVHGWPDGTLLGQGPTGTLPAGVTFMPGGDFAVWIQNSGPAQRFDGTTFAYKGDLIQSGAGGGIQGRDIEHTPWGEYLVAGGLDDVIARFDENGNSLGLLFPPGTGGVSAVWGIAISPNGEIYASSAETDEVMRFSQAGAFLGVFVTAGSGGLDEPYDLCFGPNGDLFVASRSLGKVFRYDGNTGASLGEFANVSGTSTRGCAFGPDGDLYVCSWQGPAGGAVYRFDGTSGEYLGPFVIAPSAMFIEFSPGCFCNEVPTIVEEPESVLLEQPGLASFDVIATSCASEAYQWRRDGFALANGPTVTGATTPKLTLAADHGDIGLYDCVIANKNGQVASEAVILAIRPGCYPDCDGNGTLDFFDFLCFTNQFSFGCP